MPREESDVLGSARSWSARARVRRRWLPPMALTCLSFAGCAEVLEIPEDPSLLGPWSCLEQPAQAASPDDTSALVRVQACNFVSTNCAEPVTGLTASLCSKRDVTCANPIQTGIREVGGEFQFEVSTGGVLGDGFDGYLAVSMPSAPCTDELVFGPKGRALCSVCDPSSPSDDCAVPIYAPALLFFNPPIKADIARPIPLPLVPSGSLQPLIEASGGSFAPTTGYVFMSALDCSGQPAAGVRYSLSRYGDVATVLYLEGGVISNTAVQTDASGLGGFLGVPPGFVSIAGAAMEPDQDLRMIGEVGVQVAAFAISYTTLTPSSR